MKEVEKNEIKRLSDRLDAIRHQQADLSHPMTELGREMGLKEMTGFAKSEF